LLLIYIKNNIKMPEYQFNKNAFKSIVNNGDLDPIQGYDVDVWALDQGTGAFNLIGRFNSIQIVIKNATETYLEFNQRVPRNLDGDIQIGWIMERGQLDGRVLEQTFGVPAIGRSLRINRMPRLQITFSLNAKELSQGRTVALEGNNFAGNSKTGNSVSDNRSFGNRQVNHEMVLSFCKVDTFTIAATAGKNIVANRWEGLAEGIDVINRQSTDPGLYFSTVTALNAKAASQSTFNPFKEDGIRSIGEDPLTWVIPDEDIGIIDGDIDIPLDFPIIQNPFIT
jgi:hypothetical protein